jgi:hypothetical protein
MDNRTIGLILGVAAAAAVLALIVMARRRGLARLPGRELRVADDFAALQRLRQQGGAAGSIAQRIIDSEREPWTFALEVALRAVAPPDQRVLLHALADAGIGIEKVRPLVGELFDSGTMQAATVMDGESRWVVAQPVDVAMMGYRRGARMLARAEVSTCTADWWCLAHAAPECPVGRVVREDPEKYTGLDPEYVTGWTVAQGFRAIADLRRDFDESILQRWATRYSSDLHRRYPDQSTHHLVRHGEVGESYDPSVMKAVGGDPVADARVVVIEQRDGLPQHGFGCRGAPPLLYAVVRVEEA